MSRLTVLVAVFVLIAVVGGSGVEARRPPAPRLPVATPVIPPTPRPVVTTVLVTPLTLGQWSLSGNIDFVAGPATAPLGTGSLALGSPSVPSDPTATYSGLNGTLLSSLSALSFATYSVGPSASLHLDVDYNGDDTSDETLKFRTGSQACQAGSPTPTDYVWQSWGALAGCWWTQDFSLSKPLSYFVQLHPDARIVSMRFEAANVYIDDFTIGVAGRTTTFDFEPAASLEVRTVFLPKEDPGRVLIGYDGPGEFDYLSGPIGVEGTTGVQSVVPGAFLIYEGAVRGTDLSQYTTVIVCTDGNGNTTSGTGTSLRIVIGGGDAVVCTITNTLNPVQSPQRRVIISPRSPSGTPPPVSSTPVANPVPRGGRR